MKYLVTSFFFFVCSIAYSQETSSFEAPPNSVYVELIGNGIMYSVNFDRVIKTRDRMKFSARIGFSYVDIGLFDEIEGVVVPIELLGWVGDKGHFEFGAGLSSQFVTLEDDSLLGGPSEPTILKPTTSLADWVIAYKSRMEASFSAPDLCPWFC